MGLLSRVVAIMVISCAYSTDASIYPCFSQMCAPIADVEHFQNACGVMGRRVISTPKGASAHGRRVEQGTVDVGEDEAAVPVAGADRESLGTYRRDELPTTSMAQLPNSRASLHRDHHSRGAELG